MKPHADNGAVQPEDRRVELVFSEAVRTLEDQQSLVEGIRARAGTLLAAASIATSFLAGIALRGRTLQGWGWWAIGCFVGVLVLCLMILWPTRRWVFRPNAKLLLRDYVDADPPVTLAEMHRNLALHMEDWAAINGWKMRWLFFYFQAASVLLGAEILLWIIDLWRR